MSENEVSTEQVQRDLEVLARDPLMRHVAPLVLELLLTAPDDLRLAFQRLVAVAHEVKLHHAVSVSDMPDGYN